MRDSMLCGCTPVVVYPVCRYECVITCCVYVRHCGATGLGGCDRYLNLFGIVIMGS